jgi:mono/diheme cytochrome c family protein
VAIDRFRVASTSLLLLGLAAGVLPAAEPAPDFEREIQPILAEHCSACHGVDGASRQGGFRLDTRDGALAGGDSGPTAVLPGKGAESLVVHRIRSTDPDSVMPPPETQKPLSEAQKALLERWIDAGVPYAPHWAFVSPKRPMVPRVSPPATHPIDAFVRAKLPAVGLEPSLPADPAVLCRRLWLDVVGLPPTADDVAAYLRDGHDATVEKLLASERYGEKWARPWLDLARYSDTNGYEKDSPREQWAWRDWVIGALNRDLPYDRFVIEQIAGDLLPNATQDQIVATGFLRNSMLNEEGAIIPEEFRMVEMFDRIDCLGKAVLGISAQCAQCHSHKFDPLSQEEYFGLFAFLNDTHEARSSVRTPEQLAALAAVRQRLADADAAVKEARPGWEGEMKAWAEATAAGLIPWTPLDCVELGSVGGLNHPTQEEDHLILTLGMHGPEIFVVTEPRMTGATGLQVEALLHGDLFQNGPGRHGPWALGEVDAFVQRPGSDAWEKVTLVNPTADFSEPESAAPPPADKPNEKRSIGPVANLVDGNHATWWKADRGPERRHQPSVAVLQFEKPLDLPEGTKLKIALHWPGTPSLVGAARLSLTTSPAPVAPATDHAAILALRTPEAQRTAADRAAIFEAWRKTVPELKDHDEAISRIWREMPGAQTTVLHLAPRPPSRHRTTRLLDRGDWMKPLQAVEAHVPAALHPLPAGAPANRLGFAQWLVARESPLAARVAVNRVWQSIFGQGLAEVPDDFGTRSPVPLHRDLLDWLAVGFMDDGFSQKRLLKTIVTSDTYKQSSRATPTTIAADPANRFLARGPRFRADAEVVRDLALTVSGLVTHASGGPGVMAPVPQNVIDYNYGGVSWKAAEGPDRYRRSVYLHRKRSMPDPLLSAFDAPNGDIACARRLRSNTPLAALAGLNEPVFVEAARALALKILRDGGADDEARIRHAFAACTGRLPTGDETNTLLAFLDTQRRRIADGWLDSREVATGSSDTIPSLPAGATPQDAAAWTLVARVLLNLDETVSKH